MSVVVRLGRAYIGILALAAGCTGPAESPPSILPHDVSIAVEIDGRSLAPIDRAALASQPDMVDQHRLAWRLDRLVPEMSAARQLVVERRDGQRVVLPLGAGGAAPSRVALVLNRKGEVVIALLDPEEPFPAFHGRGGNRGRAPGGERIRDPLWLRLRTRPPERQTEHGATS